MKHFECQNCGQWLTFENSHCERCGHVLGYDPDYEDLIALVPERGDFWQALKDPARVFRFCANSAYQACNWLVPAEGPDALCQACRLNRIIPRLEESDHIVFWRRLEVAKHRMIYGLKRLNLPVLSKQDDPDKGVAFEFLSAADMPQDGAASVVTGHANGVITIDLSEADHVERERQRRDMSEPYRTLLGHFRHEIGHYYWERLVADQGRHESFRVLFGDERQDYGEALARHYEQGPPIDWPERYVSSYATMHAWEDFAETWAHYMHIVDTLETAEAYDLQVRRGLRRQQAEGTTTISQKGDSESFDAMIEAWLPMTYAVNSLNRSMGQPDLYPFVLSQFAIDKIEFVHELIQNSDRS
ncbi:zinc-binding metallopeptidase family protein [Denitrobaculum tricleocarpae]|uniref:Zinc-ribbon domain-containing protein n=1 Tax=Denitrobaculum tricleocarpae TaxID=2591009 RepID=A0A545TX42_9PROT|nr:putative zinc-binding peptidase [Denitrobaculum tricleocarpae]TQV81783.1 hypothetical protein FKG95_05955 [Denitrobaculum tricleocarpae]